MSADRFTLEAMFAMELHRYQDICEEIIANAVKELSIEKGVKEISAVSSHTVYTTLFIVGPLRKHLRLKELTVGILFMFGQIF